MNYTEASEGRLTVDPGSDRDPWHDFLSTAGDGTLTPVFGSNPNLVNYGTSMNFGQTNTMGSALGVPNWDSSSQMSAPPSPLSMPADRTSLIPDWSVWNVRLPTTGQQGSTIEQLAPIGPSSMIPDIVLSPANDESSATTQTSTTPFVSSPTQGRRRPRAQSDAGSASLTRTVPLGGSDQTPHHRRGRSDGRVTEKRSNIRLFLETLSQITEQHKRDKQAVDIRIRDLQDENVDFLKKLKGEKDINTEQNSRIALLTSQLTGLQDTVKAL